MIEIKKENIFGNRLFFLEYLPFRLFCGRMICVNIYEHTEGEVQKMPNIKSAIKRVSVIEKKTARNNMIKTGYRTAVKKFEKAVEEANVEEATKLFAEATKKIDQACTKGVIVKNTASRKKSRLAKKLNAIKA